MARFALRADVHIHVDYDDQNPCGSPVGDLPDRFTRELYAPVIEYVQAEGYAGLVREAPALLARSVEGAEFQSVSEPAEGGTWRLKPEYLFPDPDQARPRRMAVMREDIDRQVAVMLPLAHWPRVHALLGALCGAGADDDDPTLHPDVRGMLEALCKEELACPVDQRSEVDALTATSELTFVGHNTAVVRSKSTAIIIDPLLFARGQSYPEDYQPLELRQLGRMDAVLLTHSHLDHFDTASLLRFPPETPIIIPEIERETVLTVALAERLRVLGFSDVRVMEWWRSAQIGDIEIHALPFYGEQPTDTDALHPEIRNAGNTYVVRTPDFSAAFIADSGRDGLGDVRAVASQARVRYGAVDALFAGYRGWHMYPVQHIFSSVARYMPFVPPSLWDVRQQLMTTVDGAVDVAELWGARYLVPYGDGGAPWHWRIGLGPELDKASGERARFDPFPERVVAAVQDRTHAPDGEILGSNVRPLLMRPGESVSGVRAEARVVQAPGHTWPFGERDLARL